LKTITGHSDNIYHLCLNSDDSVLLSSSKDSKVLYTFKILSKYGILKVKVWNVNADFALLKTLEGKYILLTL
jgi:hypothetical protein